MSAHAVSFTITSWSPVNWRARCECREKWNAETYEKAEDQWREHVHAATGKAPRPCGVKVGRWEP